MRRTARNPSGSSRKGVASKGTVGPACARHQPRSTFDTYPPEGCVQQIKGAVLKSRLAFVQETFGQDGLQRVLAAMAEGDQRTLKMLFTSNWYPFDLGRTLDDTIVRVFGGGRTEFFERLG